MLLEENIIDGKALAEKKNICTLDRSLKFCSVQGRKPKLVAILVGDNPASLIYLKKKQQLCLETQIDFSLCHLPADCPEEELVKKIIEYNCSNDIDGIFVQMPLPLHVNTEKILNFISPEKDVDGLTLCNLQSLFLPSSTKLLPCTPQGIMHMLKSLPIALSGMNAVVVGRSNLVGMPTALLLSKENATVTICHSKTKDLKMHTRKADLIVVAAGVPKLITADHIRQGVIIIDVGIHNINGKLCGDVDFVSVQPIAKAISPVPGGVGPLTVAFLMHNCILAAEKRAVASGRNNN